MLTTNDINLLETHVAGIVQRVQHSECISDIDRPLVVKWLTAFVVTAAGKYARGAKEHGGSIFDRDLKAEMRQEVIDQFFYAAADEELTKNGGKRPL